jgi:hypothetical protein
MVKPATTLATVLRVFEVLLFGFALFMCIPPIPSDETHVYHFMPAAVIGGSAFTASLVLAARRGAENWFSAVPKLGIYLLLVYVLQMRVMFK